MIPWPAPLSPKVRVLYAGWHIFESPSHQTLFVFPKESIFVQLRRMMCEVAMEELWPIYTQSFGPSITVAASKALLNALQAGFKSANGSKNILLIVIENISTEVAHNKNLADLCERLKLWAQTITLMDAFAKRALIPHRLVRPAAKFVSKNLEVQAHTFENEKTV